MDDDTKHKMVVEAKLTEAQRLGDAIAERMAAAERFVAVAGSLGGVGLTLGLFQKQETVLVALPLAISAIYLFMIQIYTDASMHAGHRKALEQHLSEELGEKVLIAVSEVSTQHSRRRSVPMGFVLVMVIWCLTTYVGIKATIELAHTEEHIPDWLLIGGNCALILYAAVVIGVAALENVRAESRGYRVAMEAFSPTTPTTTLSATSTQ